MSLLLSVDVNLELDFWSVVMQCVKSVAQSYRLSLTDSQGEFEFRDSEMSSLVNRPSTSSMPYERTRLCVLTGDS